MKWFPKYSERAICVLLNGGGEKVPWWASRHPYLFYLYSKIEWEAAQPGRRWLPFHRYRRVTLDKHAVRRPQPSLFECYMHEYKQRVLQPWFRAHDVQKMSVKQYAAYGEAQCDDYEYVIRMSTGCIQDTLHMESCRRWLKSHQLENTRTTINQYTSARYAYLRRRFDEQLKRTEMHHQLNQRIGNGEQWGLLKQNMWQLHSSTAMKETLSKPIDPERVGLDDQKISIYEHQQYGVRWMQYREQHTHHGISGGMLAFLMGLAKTSTTLLTVALDYAPPLAVTPPPPPDGTDQQQLVRLDTGEVQRDLKRIRTTLKQNVSDDCYDCAVDTRVRKRVRRKRTIMLTSLTSGVPNMGDGLGSRKRTLVVMPKSVLSAQVWSKEIDKFFKPSRRLYWKVWHRSMMSAGALQNMPISEAFDFNRVQIVFTTYHAVMQGYAQFVRSPCVQTGLRLLFHQKWHRVVADESQTFCNPDTKIAKAMAHLMGTVKWCLSAKPIRNKEADLYAQYRFLGYERCKQVQDWDSSVFSANHPFQMKDTILHLDYDDAGIELPPLLFETIPITLSDTERGAYDACFRRAVDEYNQCFSAGAPSDGVQAPASVSAFAMLTRLRQVCIDVDLLAQTRESAMTARQLDAPSSKMEAFLQAVDEHVGKGKHDDGEPVKMICFSSFAKSIRLAQQLAIKCHGATLRTYYIDGQSSPMARSAMISNFKQARHACILFMTLKVGSLGLNLTEATVVLFLDPWWSPDSESQAYARAHRIGQQRPVTVLRLVVCDSIEERVREIAMHKEGLCHTLLNNGRHEWSGKNALAHILAIEHKAVG